MLTPDEIVRSVIMRQGIDAASLPSPTLPRLCECGRPSVHEAGWCGTRCSSGIGGCTGCVRVDGTVHGREHHPSATMIRLSG